MPDPSTVRSRHPDPVPVPTDWPAHRPMTGYWWPLPGDGLSARVRAFLDAGEPPVFVGFGSMTAPGAGEAVRGALARLGRRAVVRRGTADLSAGGPEVLVVDDEPHAELFPRMAAIVHHGGAGTTKTAARAGAPQVIVPQIVDQPYWAGRVAGLGIGAAHDGPTPTLESLSVALRTALTPGTRARATAVAGTIRTDGATVAAKLLLDAIRQERPPASA